MELIEEALKLASCDLLVVPVHGKVPIGVDWPSRATREPELVRERFAIPQADGIGVLLGPRGGVADFDIDSPEADATIQRLFDGVDIETPCFQSTRGRHYFFRYTDQLPRPDLIKIVVDGLEIRTGSGDKGAQTVVPPSGGRKWIISPDECPLAEIPQVVIDRINARYAELHQPKMSPLGDKPKTMATVAIVSDDGILNVPRWLGKRGIPILGTDHKPNDSRYFIRCPGEAAHTTANGPRDCWITQDASGRLGGSCFHSSCGMRDWQALKTAIGEPRYEDYHDEPSGPAVDLSKIMGEPAKPKLVEPIILPQDSDDDPDDDCETFEPIDLGFPEECLKPPGLIGDLVNYMLRSAKYPQPIHSLAGGLALMSLITGRRVRDIANTRTNLMAVTLGASRSGKDYPREVIKTILESVGAAQMFEEKCASNAALHGFLKLCFAGILIADELGDWLAMARSKTGMNTQPAQIITSLVKLYSSANQRYKADRYADNSKQVDISQPHIVLLGTSTGEVFWRHVTPEYLSGGLFGRVMLFENEGYVLPQSVKVRDLGGIPAEIIAEVRAWLHTFGGDGDLSWLNPTPIIVPHTPEALDRFEGHELDIARKRIKESPVTAALWSGTAEITAKLSLLFACSRSRNPLQIQLPDVDLAVRLANWLTRRKIVLCADHVAENAVEDATKRVFRIVKGMQHKGIGRYELTRKTQWLKQHERTDILNTLVNSNQIVLVEVPTKTKTKSVYVAGVHAKSFNNTSNGTLTI